MKIAIIGVGNILFKDEGVGVYAVKYLEENYKFSADVSLVDGGTLGFKLLDHYYDFDKVIILDTVSIKDKAGSVYDIPGKELMGLGTYRQTVHEVEVVGMLEMGTLLDKIADVSVVGIIPEDITASEINLTDTLKNCFDFYINKVITRLEVYGISASKNNELKNLNTVINNYANPSMQAND